MQSVRFYIFTLGTIAGMISSGCGGSRATLPSLAAPSDASLRPFSNHGYRVLYRFKSVSDGESPEGLTNVNGVLFGSASEGGSGCSPRGCGTVFSITPTGKEHLLYSFKGGSDGESPSSLTNVNGTLYGTTGGGGNEGCSNYGCGTIFKISISGKEEVLYRFKGGSDGFSPSGPLTFLSGELYGETGSGGDTNCVYGCGTIFKVSTSGKEQVLYRFKGGSDGVVPLQGLLALKGVLYGTTLSGGIPCDVREGCGTAFKVTTSGHETVLHRFKGAEFSDPSPDGGNPLAGLVALNGTLYGTTQFGGNCCYDGETMGTVYALSTTGKERVIYRFNGGSDGISPVGTLAVVNGVLYGSTPIGGSSKCAPIPCGTIFSVTPSGKESILYEFKGIRRNDGAQPEAPLTDLNGALYGTTIIGGIENCGPSSVGCGTVFRISP